MGGLNLRLQQDYTMSTNTELEQYLTTNFPDKAPRVLEKFETYYHWLLDENKKINLISRQTAPPDVWVLHFLDSILATRCVDFRNKRILDIGTGGGFPGIPLAILFPDAHITLLDSTKKKIQAVREGALKTGVTNASFLDIRLEEIPAAYFGKFDIVVSRSVRIVPEYKKIIMRLLTKDGTIVLYKSRNLDDAALFIKATIHDVSSPSIGERKIVVVHKAENC